MRLIRGENGDRFLLLTKKEFEKQFMVGCLCNYSSTGKPSSEVTIKVYGKVPDLKHCVLTKPKKEGKLASK